MTNLGLALLFWTFIVGASSYIAGSEIASKHFEKRSDKHV
ncbi:Uncharacterised protein [Listeria grayi]|uniref:Uncharacterized protein n=1 Tax=Listeria grayi TaxID=1641 RepID=A0A378MIY1_LISGR|nr:Uncharacterised protein [Listeria grayi]